MDATQEAALLWAVTEGMVIRSVGVALLCGRPTSQRAPWDTQVGGGVIAPREPQ